MGDITARSTNNAQLLDYIKRHEEIDPDTYDGSYKLVPAMVKAYSELARSNGLNKCDIEDLDAIYLSAIGTWKSSYTQKKEKINASHLSDAQKAELCRLVDELKFRAEKGEFSCHGDGSGKIGMFGTGFFTFKKNPITLEQVRNLIRLLVNVVEEQDEDKLIALVEQGVKAHIPGIRTGSLSIILHCLRPYVFPIINGNQGINQKIYSSLGIELEDVDDITKYIANVRRIKAFRDEPQNGCKFKNYRVFDIAPKDLIPVKCWVLITDPQVWREASQLKKSFVEMNVGEENFYPRYGKDGKAKPNSKKLSVGDLIICSIKKKVSNPTESDKENAGKICGLCEVIQKDDNGIKIKKTTHFDTPISLEDIATKVNSLHLPGEEKMADRTYGGSWISITNRDYERIVEIMLDENQNLSVDAAAALDSDSTESSNKICKKCYHPLNLILYGPPGTGKTYNTVRHAVAIIENKTKEEIDKVEYAEVFKRYKQCIGSKRIAFTTFHQAYGYEEFIEGIKPIPEDGEVKYDVVPGIFKEFCDNARKLKDEVIKNYGFNSSPTVWKVSLEGTGDNPTRRDCLNNDRIRIGWESYGKNLDSGIEVKDGKNILGAFLNKMRKGDIVLSCYSASTIDAIGVVVGDYEWLDESFSPYRRSRNVKWIVKGIQVDITAINKGKNMTLSTVYRLDISVDDVIDIINNNKTKSSEANEYDYDTPYVFIIDEINRGNIAKIFGELITLIEPSKRRGVGDSGEETTCTLPYSQQEFGVPKNVYIIGTMNTADRSLVQLDAALRRRFDFIEMMPDTQVIRDKVGENGVVDNIDIARLLEKINDNVEALLDREHQIGHSYFLDVKSVGDLARVFKQKIIPLLQEYFFDDYESIQMVLSKDFVEERDNPFDNGKRIFRIKPDMPTDPVTYQKIYDSKIADNTESERHDGI